jgi:uncharacterized protein (TIGR03435 family)
MRRLRISIVTILISMHVLLLAQQATLPTATAYPLPVFTVSTVKLNNRNDGRWRMGPSRSGFSAMGVTMHQLIQEAYGIYDNDRILAEPGWVTSQKYDVEAKVDDEDEPALSSLDIHQRGRMLQALLADRFKLTAHPENREHPIYALTVAKNGPRLQATRPDAVPPGLFKDVGGLVRRSLPGELTVQWMTMGALAQMLTQYVDRLVVDKTGLTAHYDFNLAWTPDEGAPTHPAGADANPMPAAPAGPSIFTALQEQLGLKLEAQKGPVEVIVIDHVEPPSED